MFVVKKQSCPFSVSVLLLPQPPLLSFSILFRAQIANCLNLVTWSFIMFTNNTNDQHFPYVGSFNSDVCIHDFFSYVTIGSTHQCTFQQDFGNNQSTSGLWKQSIQFIAVEIRLWKWLVFLRAAEIARPLQVVEIGSPLQGCGNIHL